MNGYTVYLHISPDGKRYYGTTKQSVNRRWRNGKGYNKRQERFWEAIQKYGWDNIQHIIVARGLTKEEAYWLEIELIKEWDTTNRDKGYNIAKGGYSANGRITSEETKKKLSKVMIGKHDGKNNPSAKSVICITTNKIFNTAKEGAEYYNCDNSTIIKCCKGKYKSSGKYKGEKLVWRYLVWNHNKTYRISGG